MRTCSIWTDDGRTDDDGRQVINIAHPEPCSGELKKGKRKVQGVPKSQAAAHPRHEEEGKTDKTKQALTHKCTKRTKISSLFPAR